MSWPEIIGSILGSAIATGVGGYALGKYFKGKKAPAGEKTWEDDEREIERKRREYLDKP